MIDPITPFKTQKVLDLCSGIGGFTLGHLISGGFETVAFCEINQYCQQILNLRFPQIPIIGDIHDITVESLARIGVGNIDGIIAGLPCPPKNNSQFAIRNSQLLIRSKKHESKH